MGDEGMMAAIQEFVMQLSDTAAKAAKKPNLQHSQVSPYVILNCKFEIIHVSFMFIKANKHEQW